eukprot:15450207-Alexandrium_andersonii.AAC.1
MSYWPVRAQNACTVANKEQRFTSLRAIWSRLRLPALSSPGPTPKAPPARAGARYVNKTSLLFHEAHFAMNKSWSLSGGVTAPPDTPLLAPPARAG